MPRGHVVRSLVLKKGTRGPRSPATRRSARIPRDAKLAPGSLSFRIDQLAPWIRLVSVCIVAHDLQVESQISGTQAFDRHLLSITIS